MQTQGNNLAMAIEWPLTHKLPSGEKVNKQNPYQINLVIMIYYIYMCI